MMRVCRKHEPLGASFSRSKGCVCTYQPPSPDQEVRQVGHHQGDYNLRHSEEPMQASARDSGQKAHQHHLSERDVQLLDNKWGFNSVAHLDASNASNDIMTSPVNQGKAANVRKMAETLGNDATLIYYVCM